MERFINNGLQAITEEGWEEIERTIDNSSKHVYGVTPEYVEAAKKFAHEIYRFIQKKTVNNDWLESFRTPEEFTREYTNSLRGILDKYLRDADKDAKRTIISLINHFMDRTKYFAVFPVVEERIDKDDLRDAGDHYVRVSVVLPDGKRIPIKNT